jgi:hypothetical protein
VHGTQHLPADRFDQLHVLCGIVARADVGVCVIASSNNHMRTPLFYAL